jgi:hypothetical protein
MIRGKPLMREAILNAARACAKARREPIRTISRLCYGHSAALKRIASGKPFTIDKWDLAMEWLDDPENWPGGVVSEEVVDLFVPQQLDKDHAP